ncbi:MAG: nitrous oxide-stimulated promoter family protein [Clostridiaceae bacterium]
MKNKIENQKAILEIMIKMYCNKKHKTKEGLCEECGVLFEYAIERLENCKFGENKTSCGMCKVHCYKEDMRDEIRKVMKFSGPRMILYHPKALIKHGIESIKDK